VIPTFFAKQNMSSNQVEEEIIKHAANWDNHTIVTWVYEMADVIYFLGQEEGQYHVDISHLLKDLLYKDIPVTLYVKLENVMDRESVFIAWDHNGTSVKYLQCAFKGIYVLDVFNLLEDLLYDDISTKFHVYNTHDYFDIM
jgi:hypothetical protein